MTSVIVFIVTLWHLLNDGFTLSLGIGGSPKPAVDDTQPHPAAASIIPLLRASMPCVVREQTMHGWEALCRRHLRMLLEKLRLRRCVHSQQTCRSPLNVLLLGDSTMRAQHKLLCFVLDDLACGQAAPCLSGTHAHGQAAHCASAMLNVNVTYLHGAEFCSGRDRLQVRGGTRLVSAEYLRDLV
jgi:hypothetical protein